MAIEISYNSEFNFIFEKSYAKIENIRIDVERDICWIDVRFYADQKARETEGSMGVGKKSIEIKLSELQLKKFDIEAIKTACYEKLKTLDEFKGGIDV